jgi:hypothetical protein
MGSHGGTGMATLGREHVEKSTSVDEKTPLQSLDEE